MKLCEIGLIEEESSVSKQQVVIDDTKGSKKKSTSTIIDTTSSTRGSLQKSKKVIYNDKLISSSTLIQTTKLSRILGAELTTRDTDSNGFWNNYSKEISERLSYPMLTDSHDSELKCSDGSSKNSMPSSQSCRQPQRNHPVKNTQKNSWKSLQFSQQGTTVQDDTQLKEPKKKPAKILRTRKIRFFPNEKQRELLERCFSAHRYFYNKTVEFINVRSKRNREIEENKKAKEVELGDIETGDIEIEIEIETEETEEKSQSISHISARKNIHINNKDKSTQPWIHKIPFDTRDLAIKCCITGWKASMTLLKNKHINHFNMSFLSKKGQSGEICYINDKALRRKADKFHIFQERLLSDSELSFDNRMHRWMVKNIKSIDNDFNITKNKANMYYLNIAAITKQQKPSKKQNCKIVSLDPGIRTFQTFYSLDNYGKIGNCEDLNIKPITDRIDKLNTVKDTTILRSKTKYNINRRLSLLRTKIKSKVNDMHWKAADFLTKEYDVILIPIFESQKMMKKSNNSNLNRSFGHLSHFAFKKKLKQKCEERSVVCIECSESYTSKTCGGCGWQNNNLGSNKVFKCEACPFICDRDYNGARNILIRSLTKYFNLL